MKFTLAAVAASMAATTMANPILSKHWGQRWGHNKEEGKRTPYDLSITSIHQTD
jgi:Spy/CpxP family protein refolding chaperone